MVNSVPVLYRHYRDRRLDSRDRQLFGKISKSLKYIWFLQVYVPNNIEIMHKNALLAVVCYCLPILIINYCSFAIQGLILNTFAVSFAMILSLIWPFSVSNNLELLLFSNEI